MRDKSFDKPHFMLIASGIAFIATLIFQSYFTFFLDNNLVFEQNDILFDSDPLGKRHYLAFNPKPWQNSYPNIFFFTSFLTTAASFLLEASGASVTDSSELQLRISLYIVPFCSALKAVVVCLLALSLRLDFWPVILMAIISLFSFSNMIFGSLPDAYGISSLFITSALLMASLEIIHERRLPTILWLLCGVVIVSTLVTNLMIFAVIFAVVLFNRNKKLTNMATQGVGFVFFVIVIVLGLNFALRTAHEFYNSPYPTGTAQADSPSGNENVVHSEKTPKFSNKITSYLLKFDPSRRLIVEFPLALSSSVVLPEVVVTKLKTAEGRLGKTLFSSNFANSPALTNWFVIFFVMTAIILGTWAMCCKSREYRYVALICISVIVFNWIFHSIWGGPEIFLYSQHWTVAALVLIAGNFLRIGWADKSRQLGVGLLAILAVANNSYRILEIAQVVASGTT